MITRDIRHVLLKNVDKSKDLIVGRYLTLVLLLAAMATAPLISKMGGIYEFVQTMLSLFQGPMLALLLLGAFTRRATATAGLWTLITGVMLATIVLTLGVNMLYVAFASFIYSLIALWTISGFTQPEIHPDYDKLTYVPWWRQQQELV